MRRVRAIAGAICATLLFAGIASATGTAGATDTGFGTGGFLAVSADRLTTDASNRVLVADRFLDANGDYVLRVRRFLADGSLDSGFAEITLAGNPGSGGTSGILDLEVDGAGRIVLGARTTQTSIEGKGRRQRTVYSDLFVVRRYFADGAEDTAFGSSGEVVLGNFTESDAFSGLSDVQILAGDKILAIGDGPVQGASSGGRKGKKSSSSSSRGLVVARLDVDGALDDTYGDSGYARVDRDTASDFDISIRGAATQSDGSLVLLSGGGGASLAVLRIDGAGARDAYFGVNGLIEAVSGHELTALAVDSEDRVYVSSFDYEVEVRVARYSEGGSLQVETTLAHDWTALRGLHVDEDALGNSRATVICSIVDSGGSTGAVFPVRLTTDGQGDLVLDGAYGPDADGVGDAVEGLSDAPDSALDSDGALVVRIDPPPGSSPRELWRICGDA